ncbi:MAG: transposase [Caldisericia bacterium]
MANKRIIVENGIYHIIQKGVEDRNIFLDDEDYKFYLKELKEGLSLYQISLLSYALLKNHFHLLIKIKDKSLSYFMHKINNNYAHYFNDKYFRRGHLFASRYKSILVKDDRHFLTLIKYINLNPFTYNNSDNFKYEWCSYNEIINNKSKLINLDELKNLLYINYEDLIEYIKDKSKREDFNNISNLNKLEFDEEEIKRKIIKIKENLDENSTKNFYSALIYFLHNKGISFRKISSILNLSNSYVYEIYKKSEVMVLKDRNFINWINRIEKILVENTEQSRQSQLFGIDE